MITAEQKGYFYLFACCIPVKGYARSIIVDTQRNNIFFIPNSLHQILTKFKNKKIEWIRSYFKNSPIIDQYYEYLIDRELGVYVETLTPFPSINLIHESHRRINNFIIEISNQSTHNYKDIFFQIDSLQCETVELRFLNEISLESLNLILDSTLGLSIRSLNVILPFTNELLLGSLKEFLPSHPIIKNINIYRCDFSKSIDTNSFLITYQQQKDILPDSCGKVSIKYFSPCLEMIKESTYHNSCLFKKMSISQGGEIKNCPSSNKSFGNIKNNKLKNIVDSLDFQKCWDMTKDKIDICKDCEFRYVCIDCRIYIKDNTNIYSQPAKCTYNPYIAKWEGEEGYYPVELHKK